MRFLLSFTLTLFIGTACAGSATKGIVDFASLDLKSEGLAKFPVAAQRLAISSNGQTHERLPGNIIHLQPPTFWAQYKWYVIVITAAALLEALLIIWLLAMQRRRRQAEHESKRFAALAEAEHRKLTEVVSNVPGIVWETRFQNGSQSRKTTFISNHVETMLGYSPQEWLSQDGFGFSIMLEEDRAAVERDTNAVIEKAVAGTTRYRWRTKDGRVLWVESHLNPILDEHGTTIGLRGVTMDISKHKEAEAALTRVIDELRQSEDRFAKAFRANPQPMSLTTLADGRYLDVNESFVMMSGYSREEVLGRTSLELNIWETPQVRADFIKEFTAQGSIRNRETMFRTKRGSFRVLLSSVEQLEIDGEKCLLLSSSDITERKVGEVALEKALEELNELKNQLQEENIYLQQELQLNPAFGEIVGKSDPIKYVLSRIGHVAPTDSTVLITGETGTGKELVARAIHSAGARASRPLIKVNCAALTVSLIESELFGHEKGAFTGAGARKLGRFDLADRGTLFLDEIGELPLELQVKLLRVLQEGEFERVGGTKTIRVDVRIIAATNRNLKHEVEVGNFRGDLWYRLNVFPITVPPLEQRKEDIPLLVEYFVNKSARKFNREITSVSQRTMQALQAHSWPGNVRELANVIERAVINSDGPVLKLADSFESTAESRAQQSLEEVERQHIINTLESTAWKVGGPAGAARILGLNPSTLRTRMIKLGIQRRHSAAAGSLDVH